MVIGLRIIDPCILLLSNLQLRVLIFGTHAAREVLSFEPESSLKINK